MEPILLLFILISSSLLFGAIFKMLFFSKKKTNQRLNHYLNLEKKEDSLNKKEFNFALRLRLANEMLKKSYLEKQRIKILNS
ncbi:hypothetical protein [Anaerobacillus sp. CMMVII]|uniref:hypothetical protein n=1 Tax=Anaerobacillus sp. CMMVII TaxID=2755588 RepID=UPI0021B6FBF8|nr:hypothetical protein [Anaerobacillus sp. CMMVII]